MPLKHVTAMEPFSETRVRKKRKFRSVQDVANLQEVESLTIHGAFKSGGHRVSVPDMKEVAYGALHVLYALPITSELT